MKTGKHGERYTGECSTNKVCDMDGYHPSPTGVTEYYWHCKEIAVGTLASGLSLCAYHLKLWTSSTYGKET